MSKVFRSFMAQAARGGRSRRNFSSLPEGKQTISLADEFNRQVMTDIMSYGSAFVGAMTYYVKEYVPIYNAKQEYIKLVAQAIKEEQAIMEQQAIKEQATASAGPEEELK